MAGGGTLIEDAPAPAVPTTRADLRECLQRSVATGALLGFVDTAFTYTTGHAPFGDVALIVGVPLVLMTFLGGLALAVARLLAVGQAPRLVDGTLLIAPVLLFGARGCLSNCDLGGWNLALRWLPTVFLFAGLAVFVSRRRPGWEDFPRLLFVAGITQLLAALAFGIRTDEYLSIGRAPALLCLAAVVAGATWTRARSTRPSPRFTSFVVVLALAVAWLLRATPPGLPAGSRHSDGGMGKPNVLLIVLDTVRSDHLSLYGYPRRTSPNLDAFATSSLVFDRARANATYSLASHASVFTGLAPSGHGARPIPASWVQRHPTLNLAAGSFRVRSDATTIAEDLKALGYFTAGLSGNDVYLGKWTGLQRGFDAFEAEARRRYRFSPLAAPFISKVLPRIGISQPSFFQDTWRAGEITDAAIAWLRRSPSPFFLFINYFDAHAPYDPPGGTPFDGETEVAKYDGEIAFLDRHLGRLLQFLHANGQLEQTLVIITSDHGEYFGEHGLRGHPPVLYEPVLSVPLVVRMPGRGSARRVRRWTGLHELRGLIRERVASRKPLSILSDRPGAARLAEAWEGAAVDTEPSSVVTYLGDFKLFAHRSSPEQLFDLAGDPGESRDLLGVSSSVPNALLDGMRRASVPAEAARVGDFPETPSEAIERLRALGYVQ